MYRVNSISRQVVKFQVKKEGKLHDVSLMPGNFVFSEEKTNQMKNLENSGVIRVREVASKQKEDTYKGPNKDLITKKQKRQEKQEVGTIELNSEK